MRSDDAPADRAYPRVGSRHPVIFARPLGKVNETEHERPCDRARVGLTSRRPGANNPRPARGPPMRRGTGHGGGFHMADLDSRQAVSRRAVLKGGVAVAALGGVSAFLAACGTSASSA